MVKLMLEGFGGDHRRPETVTAAAALGIDCYHVNARLSRNLADIGEIRPQKFFLLFGYCLQAIWCRFRHGVTHFYYIPSPGKRGALFRDWMVMAICRPFFHKVILHWHAAGLSKWLETSVQIRTRALTYRLMRDTDLSIVLSDHGRTDGEKFLHPRITVVPNGIPDPCPDFEPAVLPRRQVRAAARKKIMAGIPLAPADLAGTGDDPHIFKVLYLAHCFREKGLFDAVEAVAIANQQLITDGSTMRIQLIVAGKFVDDREKTEFGTRINAPDFQAIARNPATPAIANGMAPLQAADRLVHYCGFVSGAEKRQAFLDCDCFCFPTYYQAESFGLVLAEALAFGLPAVTTRWRAIPEVLPENHPGLVDIRSPGQIARALVRLMQDDGFESYRRHFLDNYTLDQHLKLLAKALHSVEPEPSPMERPKMETALPTP